MRDSLFGSKEDKAVAEKREKDEHQKRVQGFSEEGHGKTEKYIDDQGREWTIAAVVDPSSNKEYVQAQRWDGLQWVGSKEWVARKSDAGETYVGFNPRRKLELSPEEWRRVLHHVTVEILALAQAGRDVNAVYTERAVRMEDWKRTANVMIKQTDGAIELQLPTNESLESILKAMPQSLAEEIMKAAENDEMTQAEGAEEVLSEVSAQQDVDAQQVDAEMAQAEGAEEMLSDASDQQEVEAKQIDAEEKATMRAIKKAVKKTVNIADSEWLQTPLADPAIKLAVIKRVQQLTGHRVRDPVISSATSVFHLYQALKTRSEPEKLAHAKQLRKVNLDLPNVTVHDHRRTPIHKHQEVGRWKVIEEELINRGLPVTGSRWQGAKTTSPII